MFPNELLNRLLNAFVKKIDGSNIFGVDPSAGESGDSITLTGNGSSIGFVTPPAGKRIVVKGMFINGDGNSGTGKIKTSGGKVLLPSYFTNQGPGTSPSDSTNLTLPVDETVDLETLGRGAGDETFFGVSYFIIN